MNLLPKPKNHRVGWTTAVMPQHVYRYIGKKYQTTGYMRQKDYRRQSGRKPALCCSFRRRSKGWRFSLGITETLSGQAYEITIQWERRTDLRWWWSRCALWSGNVLSDLATSYGGALPCVQIMDALDMPNRGYYFDLTRGRILKLEELKKLQTGCPTIS